MMGLSRKPENEARPSQSSQIRHREIRHREIRHREIRHRESKQSAGRWHLGSAGQATLESVIVGTVLLALILGLGALSNRLAEGLFVEHALRSASHALGPNTAGVIGDVILY